MESINIVLMIMLFFICKNERREIRLMFSFKNIMDKIRKNKGLDIDKTTLYSFLLLDGTKYRWKFSIFLLTDEQNSYSLNPCFLISYKNHISIIPIISNYYDLVNDIAVKENLPMIVIVKLNDVLCENRKLFLHYYNGCISRSETIKDFKP